MSEEKNPGFAPGDVVALKSGGPKMTVETVKDRVVGCAWFTKDNVLQRSLFVFGALDLA